MSSVVVIENLLFDVNDGTKAGKVELTDGDSTPWWQTLINV